MCGDLFTYGRRMPDTNSPSKAALDGRIPALWSDDYIIDSNSAHQLIIPSAPYELVIENDLLFAKTECGQWRVLNPDEEYLSSAPAIRVAEAATPGTQPDLSSSTWVANTQIPEPAQ